MPLKTQLYERETYFRDGLTDALEVLGDDTSEGVLRAALLVVKPDGILSGKASAVVDFVRANGFQVVAAEFPTLTRFHWRELWRYQLTCATLDRLAVNDLVLRGPALLLLLRHDGDLDVPASVRLSMLKGPSDVARQSPACLRRVLAQPNRVLSFFHVADEPADVLRELAILLDEAARRRVLAAVNNETFSAADRNELDKRLAASDAQARPLDAEGALRRAEDAVRGVDCGTPSIEIAARGVLADLDRMRRGERIAWRRFAQALVSSGANLDRWDVAMMGAAFIVYDEPGTSKLITAVDPELWRRDPAQPSYAHPPLSRYHIRTK